MTTKLDRRRFVAGLGATGALGALGVRGVAAGQATPAATPVVDLTGQEVNLYSSRHYDTGQARYDGFTELTRARVNLIEADADQMIERIKAEGQNSPADVLLTVDAGRLWRAQQDGLLHLENIRRSRGPSPSPPSRSPAARAPAGWCRGISAVVPIPAVRDRTASRLVPAERAVVGPVALIASLGEAVT